MGYTAQTDPDITSRALGKELPISPKHSREICNMLKGMHVEDAIDLLEDIMDKKKAVPLKRYNKRVSHKKGTGPGRYPKKAAEQIKKVVRSAMHNADYKGLNGEGMRIKVIAAHRGQTTEGYQSRAYGRTTPWNQETVNIEVILEEE